MLIINDHFIMENSINLSILLPLMPLGMALFIFLLLRSFNKTINRLTKPISYLAIISILLTTGLSTFFLISHSEGNIPLSDYLYFLNNYNLEIHINQFTEKIIIIVGLIFSSIILFSVLKLPRRSGYVMYVVNLNFLASLFIATLLIVDFHF